MNWPQEEDKEEDKEEEKEEEEVIKRAGGELSMLEASSVRARHGEKETTSFVVVAAAAAVRPRERAAERFAHRYVSGLINFTTAFNANTNFFLLI